MTTERTTLITANDHPEGCTTYQLTPTATGPRTVIGRRAESGQPCPRPVSSCGPGTAETYRCPSTGLNIPGEPSPVLELVWCSRCGYTEQQLVGATEQEQQWGWAIPSQV